MTGDQQDATVIRTAPTAGALVAGAYLRALRQRRGLTLRVASDMIRGSVSKVSRMETGGPLVRETDVAVLMRNYGVTSPDRVAATCQMLKPQRATGEPGETYVDSGRGWLDRFHACLAQGDATAIYTGCAIPDAVRIPAIPPDEIRRRAEREDPPQLPRPAALVSPNSAMTLLLDATVLMRSWAIPDVMAAQMAHLQHLMTTKQGPRILVLPLDGQTLPPYGIAYNLALPGGDDTPLVIEEYSDYAVYYTGARGARYRDRVAAAAARGAVDSFARLEQARRAFERQAERAGAGAGA